MKGRVKAKRRILIYCLAAPLISIAGLYAYLAISKNPSHFWKIEGRAKVTINGQRAELNIYSRPSGKLLIDFGEDKSAYVYYPELQNMGLCNRIRGVTIPGYIYAKDYDDDFCPCAQMGTAKTEVETKVMSREGRLGFTTIDNQRVEVSW